MKIAPNSIHYALTDIGTVDVEPALPSRDEKDLYKVGLIQTVAEEVKVQLEKNLEIEADRTKPLALKARITKCTEGNRAGRILVGELGVGWAKLFLEWEIVDTTNNAVIFGPVTEKMKDSGTAGLADITESNIGQQAVHKMATQKSPATIAMKVKGAFHRHGARQ